MTSTMHSGCWYVLSTKETAEEVPHLVSSSGILLCGWTTPWAKEASLTV